MDRLLGALLRWAVRLAGAGFAVALLLRPVPELGRAADPAAGAGAGVLLAAPFLGALSAAIFFGRRRRWRDAGLAALLLVLLAAGAWIGSG